MEMFKKVSKKEDGRYIIFYEFKEKDNLKKEESSEKKLRRNFKKSGGKENV